MGEAKRWRDRVDAAIEDDARRREIEREELIRTITDFGVEEADRLADILLADGWSNDIIPHMRHT